MTILAWCIAWVLDFIIGDPQHWPHPVRWIGRLITFVQRIVRRYCPGDKALRIGGGVMWVVVVGVTWGVAWGVLALAQRIHPWFGWSVEVWMIFTTLAGRSLARAAQEVERPLRENDLAESRIKLSWIVGRDTSQLQPAQIYRAVVETVAETPLTALSRRSFSSFSAARRWRWPTKPSIPWIQWWATNMKNTGRLVWSAPVWTT